jgi:hypothetical protein
MKTKDGVFSRFQEFKALVENQIGRKMLRFGSLEVLLHWQRSACGSDQANYLLVTL